MREWEITGSFATDVLNVMETDGSDIQLDSDGHDPDGFWIIAPYSGLFKFFTRLAREHQDWDFPERLADRAVITPINRDGMYKMRFDFVYLMPDGDDD